MNNGKICVPVSAETSEKALADAQLSAEFADVVEIRLDALEPDEVAPFLSSVHSEKPLLITYRPAEQGGYREISVEERVKFWNGIDGSGLDTSRLWFDQEGDLAGRPRTYENPVTIRS
ncbi:MAG TPA: type I 3-dehydroquinate dehydratase, partial [Pyrinomonadaceae bacterium]|nr:type I 3-dehydroquinate dehydratase [Pyrinomonadaceae bacterium]